MDAQWLQTLIDWVQAHPGWTGVVIFLVAFGESLLLVGILLPGAAILVGLGALIGLGMLDFSTVWLWAALGAMAGDGLSFWIGRHYHERLLSMWPINRFPALVQRGRDFFQQYGGMSVFLGRFVGPVRPVIPAIAGMMGMPAGRYIAVNITASVLWVPVYVLPGVFLSQSLAATAQVAGKLAVLLGALIALVWFAWWVISRLYRRLIPTAYRWLSRTLLWSQRHPVLGKVTAALVDPRKPESGSLATLALGLLLLAALLTWAALSNAALSRWNALLDDFIQAFHTPWTVGPVRILLSLGHDLAIAAPWLAVLGWLLYRRRKVAAWHWLAAGAFGWLLSVVLSYWARTEWIGFGHLAWLTAVLAFLAVLVSGALPVRLRSWPYALAAIEVSLVAFALVFFGYLSLTQVVVSFLLGSLWAFVLGVAYRTRNRRQFWGAPISIVFYSVHLAVASVVWLSVQDARPASAPEPLARIPLSGWIGGALAHDRTDWMNRPRERLNFHYAGSIDVLADALHRAGWRRLPVRTWDGLLQALSVKERQETAEWPVLARTNRGQVEALLMKKPDPSGQWQVLHLWPNQAVLAETGQRLYSGEILLHRPNTLWGLFRFLGAAGRQTQDIDALISVLAADGRFERMEAASTGYWRLRHSGAD